MPSDFTMSYPAYVPMRTEEIPWSVVYRDGRALAVHTDADLLDRFLLLNNVPTRRLRAVFTTGETLAQYLEALAGHAWPTLTHVLIDPTDLRRPARAFLLAEFVARLRA